MPHGSSIKLNTALVLFVFALLTSWSASALAEQQKVMVLGDSISAAYGMSLEQGWVAKLGSRLQEEIPGVRVINASISGETSAGGLRRVQSLLEKHKPALLVLQLGGNDGLRGYPISSLRENLTKIAVSAKSTGANVVIIPMEIPPNYGQRYTAAFRSSFQKVSEDTSSQLAPFIMEHFATDENMMQADGIHPVASAQELMLETVYPTIRDALELP